MKYEKPVNRRGIGKAHRAWSKPLNGICIDGKFYELAAGGCFNCDLYKECDKGKFCGSEFCVNFPYPDPEKDNCFRFSQEITDKINGKLYNETSCL